LVLFAVNVDRRDADGDHVLLDELPVWKLPISSSRLRTAWLRAE